MLARPYICVLPLSFTGPLLFKSMGTSVNQHRQAIMNKLKYYSTFGAKNIKFISQLSTKKNCGYFFTIYFGPVGCCRVWQYGEIGLTGSVVNTSEPWWQVVQADNVNRRDRLIRLIHSGRIGKTVQFPFNISTRWTSRVFHSLALRVPSPLSGFWFILRSNLHSFQPFLVHHLQQYVHIYTYKFAL